MFGIELHFCVFLRLWTITARKSLCGTICGDCGRRNLRFHEILSNNHLVYAFLFSIHEVLKVFDYFDDEI